MFMSSTNDCVPLPVAHMTSGLNRGGSVCNGASPNDLASTFSPAGVALAPLFLASQVLPHAATPGFISINIAINRLMADWQSERDLFRAPLQAKIVSNLILNNGVRDSSITTCQGLLLKNSSACLGR
jgi:hypothetical protein